MKTLVVLFVLYSGFSLENAILALTGATDISEVTEEEFERYSTLAAHPLEINSCSRTTLSLCGLLSSYQIETLLEYRRIHGDILSPTELSIVNGFAGQAAFALTPFLDFTPGTGKSDRKLHLVDSEAVAGGGIKISEGSATGQWKLRSNVEANGGVYGFGAAVGTKSPWDSPLPSAEELGWNIHANAGKWLTTVVAGCFNLRLGQGLLMWSGSTIESYSNPTALMKKPSGIIPYKGWSPSYSLKGAGARMDFGNFSILPFCSLGNTNEYGGSVIWNHRNGTIGANVCISGESQGYSVDFQQTLKGNVFYGELCWKKTPSVLLGAMVPAGNFNLGIRTLWGTKEHSVTAAMSFMSDNRKHSLNVGTSAVYVPEKHTLRIKAQGQWNGSVSDKLSLETKLTASIREKIKGGLRQNIGWDNGTFSASARAETAYCISMALMACSAFGARIQAEGIRLSADIQTGAFLVDNWDDRIYIYMYDLPGSFSVPALYGRGWWVNACAKLKVLKNRLGFGLRVMYTAYPWAREGDKNKKPALNAGIQISWNMF